ncbi:flavin reductase family protein [Alicyclobacillus tolerans]
MAGAMTTTVGLITTSKGESHNVMAAEWSYMVSKMPPHILVCIYEENITGDWIAETKEFGITFCSEKQASLANFSGSYSWNDITKLNSNLYDLYPAKYINPYLIRGGLLACECRLSNVISLPEYRLFIGEVLRCDFDEAMINSPLIKHGAMYSIGQRIDHGPTTFSADIIETEDNETMLRIAGRVAYQSIGVPTIKVTIVYVDGNQDAIELSVNSDGYFYTSMPKSVNTPILEIFCSLGDDISRPATFRIPRH